MTLHEILLYLVAMLGFLILLALVAICNELSRIGKAIESLKEPK